LAECLPNTLRASAWNCAGSRGFKCGIFLNEDQKDKKRDSNHNHALIKVI
jgi:hypothetical protein